MTHVLCVLHVDYGTSTTSLFSNDKVALMTFGRDHHRAAKIVPDLTLRGHVLATMDEYATDWTETKDAGEPDQ